MNSSTQKIVFAHMLNDYSGSPRVLAQVVKSCTDRGLETVVYAGNSKQGGFLSNIPGNQFTALPYQWSSWKFITLLRFFWAQVVLFFYIARHRNENAIIYINTILPFGAALAGWLFRKPVLYHVHETSVKPAILKRFLFRIASLIAERAIYVSRFLRNRESIPGVKSVIIPNSVSPEFIEQVNAETTTKKGSFTVLMLSSLKAYKGVFDFVDLASQMRGYRFELVINAEPEEVALFFKGRNLPDNLSLFGAQRDVHPFYRRANLVLNLSHPDQWVETFGLTALEAMHYSIPTIVPPVGGIAEVVEHAKSGFHVDVRDQSLLASTVRLLAEDQSVYRTISAQSRKRAADFSPINMEAQIHELLASMSNF